MSKCLEVRGKILTEVKNEIAKLNATPTLAIIKCNDDFASSKYVENKVKTCNSVGIAVRVFDLNPKETNLFEIKKVINKCNKEFNAVILQLPLADHLKQHENGLLNMIHPSRDIDGLTDDNKLKLMNGKGCLVPCTALAVFKIMEHAFDTTDFSGKKVCIINRSDLIGRPLFQLLLNHNATVMVAHSKTHKDINQFLMENKFDIVVTGIGKHIILDGLMDRTTIIDCGITRDENGKLLRDVVRFEGIIEPSDHYLLNDYYGMVGTVTTACVTYNVLKAYKCQNAI